MIFAASLCQALGLGPHGSDPVKSIMPDMALSVNGPAEAATVAFLHASFVLLLAAFLTYLFAALYHCYANRSMHVVTGCALVYDSLVESRFA